MTRGILIVGNEAPLASAVAAEAARRAQIVATALVPNPFAEAVDSTREEQASIDGAALASFPWIPASPISSRTLVLAVTNKLERLDDAVLVCSPASIRKRADQMAPEELDTLIDDQIKGWFFLVRELALHFRARKAGTLALVLSEAGLGGGKDDPIDLLGPSIASAFRSLAQGLLASSFSEPYRALGFSSAEAGENEAFAAHIFKTMDEEHKRDSGKWHKFGKLGLFGR